MKTVEIKTLIVAIRKIKSQADRVKFSEKQFSHLIKNPKIRLEVKNLKHKSHSF